MQTKPQGKRLSWSSKKYCQDAGQPQAKSTAHNRDSNPKQGACENRAQKHWPEPTPEERNQAKDTANKLFLTEKKTSLSNFLLRKIYFKCIQKQMWPDFYSRKSKLPKPWQKKKNNGEEEEEEKEKQNQKKKAKERKM